MRKKIYGVTVGTTIKPQTVVEMGVGGTSPNAIINSATGTTIVTTDSTNYKPNSIKLYGKSTQNGIPSKDNGIDVVSLGESGSIEGAILGKNLCPKNLLKKGWYGNGDVMGNPTTNASYPNAVYGVPFECKYLNTLAYNFGNLDAGTDVRLRCATQDETIVGYLDEVLGSSGVITIKNHFTYIIPLFLNGIPDTCLIEYSDIIPTEDDSQPFTIQTPNGLKGIGDVRDYVDFERGKYVQRIGVIESYDGEEVIEPYLSTTGELSKGATVYHILAEPIETDLTEEEMSQYNTLRMNYPSTTIINDADAHMEVEYVADTKLYVDNKFNELAVALVSQ